VKNWMCIDEEKENLIWNNFIEQFNFKQSNFKNGSGSFDAPKPYVTYDISKIYDKSLYDLLYKDLEEKMEKIFIENTNINEYIYVLDWQHPCYLYNPRIESEKNEFDEWTIPLYPDGDYYFFIKNDFSWGYLGHPWHKTITIFGQDFIKSVKKNKPIIFDTVVEECNQI
jgi:hypothetical protein